MNFLSKRKYFECAKQKPQYTFYRIQLLQNSNIKQKKKDLPNNHNPFLIRYQNLKGTYELQSQRILQEIEEGLRFSSQNSSHSDQIKNSQYSQDLIDQKAVFKPTWDTWQIDSDESEQNSEMVDEQQNY